MPRKRQCACPITEDNTYRRKNGQADGCLIHRRIAANAAYAVADKDHVRRLERERYARKRETKRTASG